MTMMTTWISEGFSFESKSKSIRKIRYFYIRSFPPKVLKYTDTFVVFNCFLIVLVVFFVVPDVSKYPRYFDTFGGFSSKSIQVPPLLWYFWEVFKQKYPSTPVTLILLGGFRAKVSKYRDTWILLVLFFDGFSGVFRSTGHIQVSHYVNTSGGFSIKSIKLSRYFVEEIFKSIPKFRYFLNMGWW